MSTVHELTLTSTGLRSSVWLTLVIALIYLALAMGIDNTYVLLIMALLPIWSLVLTV